MAQAATNGGKTGARSDAAPTDADEIRAQLDTLRQDVETLNRLLRESVEHKVHSARSQAQDALDDARDSARRKAKHAADTAHRYQAEAEAAVRDNPTAALGIATGIGFVAGLLLARR